MVSWTRADSGSSGSLWRSGEAATGSTSGTSAVAAGAVTSSAGFSLPSSHVRPQSSTRANPTHVKKASVFVPTATPPRANFEALASPQ